VTFVTSQTADKDEAVSNLWCNQT